jgi:diguanylate cyclase (GGDEF)-like protein/PAS domain S-box-containing protein
MAALLKTKRLGWAIIFLLVTVVGLISYFSGRRYVAAMAAVEHTLAVESAINQSLSLLKDAETGQRGYILSGDEQFLAPHEAAVQEIPLQLTKLSQLSRGDATQSARLATVRSLIEDKLRFVADTIEVRREGDMTQALLRVRSGRGKQIMDRVRGECGLMLKHEELLLQQRKEDARRAETTAMWGVGVGSLLTVLFALFSFLTVNRDVEELKQTAEELAKSEEYYRLLTEQSNDLVRVVGIDGKQSYVSPSVERLLGYSVEEYMNIRTVDILHPDDMHTAQQLLEEVKSGAARDGTWSYRLRNKSGEYRWFEVRWGVLRDEKGKPAELHLAGRDVTERRSAEAQLSTYAERLGTYAEQLKTLSLRDELTGLYNRRGFLEVAAQAHALALRDARPAALVFVDLNGMKRINDELGHDMGDAALVDTADVLQKALHESDVVARLGGDEFVVFALDFTEVDVDGLRIRLRQLSDECVEEAKRPYRLSMSVGAAYSPVGSAASIDDLLEQADVAMYEQKNARRAAGNVSLMPPSLDAASHKLS